MVMRIKELREKVGFSQQELANRMDVLQSTVCNWENEVALPRSRQLPELARVLNCTINDLFVGTEAAAV